MMERDEVPSYSEFRTVWLEDIESGAPSATQKGSRFAWKLVNDWFELPEGAIVHDVDGPNDGGIDLAVLLKGDMVQRDESGQQDESNLQDQSGDTWYIVQSKYGSAWRGEDTAVSEGVKIIRTLLGERDKLSEEAAKVCRKVAQFRENQGENDSLILTFATVDPPTEDEQQALDKIRKFGRQELGPIFDVELVCIRTLYDRLISRKQKIDEGRVYPTVPLCGSFTGSSNGNLLVGVVPLRSLYDFLKHYQSKTQNLDQIYEHNVRRFLGGRVKVNKEMRKTLQNEPELFGLYNNGITIVASEFVEESDGQFNLTDPYVVNGCQTTQSIWDVLDEKLDAGGSGREPESKWLSKIESGVVIVKIAKASGDNSVLRSVTRYTNSQNAISERDFVALDKDFRSWKEELEESRSIFLEIQRGGWESRKALQRKNKDVPELTESANVHELLKFYGAGWLSCPGVAFGKNQPFLPNGAIYREIMNRKPNTSPFGMEDLYATYLLQTVVKENGYGRGAERKSRGSTKYLFSFVLISLLRDVLQKAEVDDSEAGVSRAFIKVIENEEAKDTIVGFANQVIDGYLQQGAKETLFDEEKYRESNQDLNNFLKREQLGRSLDDTPYLKDRLRLQMLLMDQSMGDGPAPRERIAQAMD